MWKPSAWNALPQSPPRLPPLAFLPQHCLSGLFQSSAHHQTLVAHAFAAYVASAGRSVPPRAGWCPSLVCPQQLPLSVPQSSLTQEGVLDT